MIKEQELSKLDRTNLKETNGMSRDEKTVIMKWETSVDTQVKKELDKLEDGTKEIT